MLSIADIPDEYRRDVPDGENVARLASGVQTAIGEAVGEAGLIALNRFVQAGFLFRSSEIGRTMIRSSPDLQGPLAETSQLVNFAGGALSASSLVGAVDLSAAAIHRLSLGPINPRDEAREADVKDFPRKNELPADAKRWLDETRTAKEWEVLKSVRDGFVHRWFRLDVTIVLGGPMLHHLQIAGQRKSLGEFLNESRDFVVDRLVAAGLVMQAHADRVSAATKHPSV